MRLPFTEVEDKGHWVECTRRIITMAQSSLLVYFLQQASAVIALTQTAAAKVKAAQQNHAYEFFFRVHLVCLFAPCTCTDGYSSMSHFARVCMPSKRRMPHVLMIVAMATSFCCEMSRVNQAKRGWTGELGGWNRNIFFMRQLL